MKRIVFGIMLIILLASMLTLAFSIQSIEESGITSNVAGDESGGFEAQSGSVDWWPMFHHDLTHTAYSTSKAPETNQTLWTYTTGDTIESSAAVADGRVYYGTRDNRLVNCVNASDGSLIWNYQTAGSVISSPAIAYGKVYVASYDTHVYCLNASTGTLIWTYFVGWYAYSSPAIAYGKVYVASYDGKVYALNASTGTLKWSYATGNRLIRSSPAIADGKVYIGSGNKAYCVNASDGSLIWNYTAGSYVDMSSPAIADGKVYIGSEDYKVYCLNASTGAHIWNYTTGDKVYSSPAIADGKVYIGSYDWRVYCLNASTGTLIWSYKTGSILYSSPAIADGKVYIGSNDRKFYAFGPRDVAITSVTLSKTEAYSGQIVNITAVVKNEGAIDETFNVNAYYDSTLIETQAVNNLPQGEETTLTFNWNTTDIPGGYYTISANATIVPGETDTADNNFIDGTIKITSPVKIAEVIPCNQTGYPKNTFYQGAMAYFKVTINSTALITQNTLITINLYDNASITIGIASFQGPILPGISTIIFGLPIPTTATIGTATIYANCYTDWPSQGGFPHCSEVSATLEITGP